MTMPDSPAPPDDMSSEWLPDKQATPTGQAFSSNLQGQEPKQALPHTTALRRRRLQMARYLQCIAYLHEEAEEMRAEVSSLESIIGAQADAIQALRDQINGPQT